MKFYFAPMEGNTGHIFRRAHRTHFNHIDRYYAPFISSDSTDGFRTRDRNDILPENNEGFTLIPQILSNNAKDFTNTAKKIKQFGYTEVNLNLGCPSGTVVPKKKGSGFLAFPDELDAFLEEIFENRVMDISIKTRLGKNEHDEFYRLMEIYNKYPATELIIHPRVQKDMYRNTPNWKVFGDALATSKIPVCYNGDIVTLQDYQRFIAAFPTVDRVMIGRGLLRNPGLVGTLKEGKIIDKATLKAFHDQLLGEYEVTFFGDHNVLNKMKELWSGMGKVFHDSDKQLKRIKKSEKLVDYRIAVDRMFAECDLMES